MSEATTVQLPPPGSPSTQPEPANNRRERRDRRSAATPGRRDPARARRAFWRSIARDLAAIAILSAAIAAAVTQVKPIYAGRGKLAQQLTQVPGSAVLTLTPVDSTVEQRAVASPQFELDRRNFAADLVRTGRLSQARADSIAFYAVREAYIRGIPPAVIFGVMLTENAVFVSDASSSVGAVGLMQIYPKIWLRELGSRFGRDLTSDSTNLKYGTYILAEYIKPRRGAQTPSVADVRKGLLRYNGCVRGTNTPNCRNYPDKVKRYVEREAESMCGEKDFYQCIARPFMVGLLGQDPGD